MQACPNYDPLAAGQRAAAPPAVRKGFAFPSQEATNQRLARRLEGYAFQAARNKGKKASWAGEPEAFRTAKRQSRVA
jgi:hypothetical protein